MEERLQKIIARAGVTSRRAAEELILGGRVRVNGRVAAELGQKADPQRDKIEVDGKRLVAEQPAYIVLHKPRDVVSTVRDPEGRPTVAELVRGSGLRLYPVGRLDYATSGVLLMTNDGDFANALLHPRGGVPKTYVAKVRGVMSSDDLDPWRKGVQLEDGKTLPAEARILRHEEDKTWIEVTLREGRNQQIRRMGEATGWPILRLARLSFAGVTSEGLRPGEWRHLTLDEMLDLRKEFGVPKRVRGVVTGGGSHAPTKRPGGRRAAATATRPEGGSGGRGARRDARASGDEPAARRRSGGPGARGAAGGERGERGGGSGERSRRREWTGSDVPAGGSSSVRKRSGGAGSHAGGGGERGGGFGERAPKRERDREAAPVARGGRSGGPGPRAEAGGRGGGAERGSGRGAERGSGRGAECGSGGGAERGSGRAGERGSGRGTERGSGRGAERGSGGGAERGSGRGAERGPRGRAR